MCPANTSALERVVFMCVFTFAKAGNLLLGGGGGAVLREDEIGGRADGHAMSCKRRHKTERRREREKRYHFVFQHSSLLSRIISLLPEHVKYEGWRSRIVHGMILRYCSVGHMYQPGRCQLSLLAG